MFGKDFFPTPVELIDRMLTDLSIEGLTILEPSAGKGNIVDYLNLNGAHEVLACEISNELRQILMHKCKIIANDFLSVTTSQVSHIDAIVMNPPFSAGEQHILHAFRISPPGCKIVALCNLNTLKNNYSSFRKELKSIIDQYGSWENVGDCFESAERKTDVSIALVRLQKPCSTYDHEFDGFFLDDEPVSKGSPGIMPYNFILDVVNRYISAVKIFDEQLESAVRMNNITSSFYSSKLAFQCTEDGKLKARNDFKKDLQKNAWDFLFQKMNMNKYTTCALKDDINRFVEQQHHIPFTMKNIYRMFEIIVGTHSQRMDKAIMDVFERITRHYHENRYAVEGWKTNSHYLLNKKFIFPYVIGIGFSGQMTTRFYSDTNIVDDLVKALCYISGENYDNFVSLYSFLSSSSRLSFGVWYDWSFFEIKGFKKGTLHMKFKDDKLWGLFNQHVARIKGYPLFEGNVQK